MVSKGCGRGVEKSRASWCPLFRRPLHYGVVCHPPNRWEQRTQDRSVSCRDRFGLEGHNQEHARRRARRRGKFMGRKTKVWIGLLGALAALGLWSALLYQPGAGGRPVIAASVYPAGLRADFQEWSARHAANGGDRNV